MTAGNETRCGQLLFGRLVCHKSVAGEQCCCCCCYCNNNNNKPAPKNKAKREWEVATLCGGQGPVGHWEVRIVCPTQLQQRVINKFLQLILAVGCHIALLLMVAATMAQAQQRKQLPTVAPALVAATLLP